MNYALAFLECVSITLVIAGLEKERHRASVVKWFVYLAVYMAYFTISMVANFPPELSFVSYILLILYVKWQYEDKFWRTLVVSLFGIVIIGIIEFVAMLVISTLFHVEYISGWCQIFVMGLTCIIASVFVVRNKSVCTQKFYNRNVLVSTVMTLSFMMFVPIIALRMSSKLNILDYVYVVVCILMMWFLVFRIQRYELETKIRKEYLEGYTNVIAQIRRRQHKVKNQIMAVYGMVHLYDNYDELVKRQKEYLDKIVEYELPNDAIILEEPSVIALVYEKINEAMEKGIQVESSFSCSMVASKVSDIMWVEIIGTLLDNAIEALDEYEEEKKIWIHMGQTEEDKVFVCIANTYRYVKIKEMARMFEMGYSSKGVGRGIGLYHVKKIVDKYHGDIYVQCTEKEGKNAISFEVVI